MEVAPCPITKGFEKEIEVNLIKSTIEYNQNFYSFSLNKINDNKLKFILFQDEKRSRYENQFDLNYFHILNKYFKMFDTLLDLEKDLIELIKEKNIKISNINNTKEAILQLTVFSRSDNIVNFKLLKIELNQKEKINILENDILQMKEEFKNFKDKYINENNKLKEELKLKDMKISELEKKMEIIQIEIEKIKNKTTINSSIIKNSNEMEFILKNISENNNISLKLIYDSKIEGENEDKLINAYTEKNDIIVLVETKKNKRFGGYAHESFEKNKFHKTDSKAFLFSLDKLKIYKSNGKTNSIWRDYECIKSINFGRGTDLRIFHKFNHEKN